MDSLPSDVQNPPVVTAQPSIPMPPSVTQGGKEGEVVPLINPELPIKAVGQEMDLPKEVAAAGVTVTPQTVALPQIVQQAGVKSVGANVAIQPFHAKTTPLPLTDEQIAVGLHESMKTSVRWLAEWCVRQVKMVQAAIHK